MSAPPPAYSPQYNPGCPPPQAGGYPPAQGGYPEKGGYPQGQPQPYPTGPSPPPGQYGQQPAGGQQTTVVVTQPAVLVQRPGFGEVPVVMTCPHCHSQVSTGVSHESGTLTWVVCGSVCLAGCVLAGITWLGCCLIPFCVDSCKDVIHTCPSCKQIVGRKNRM